MKKISFVVFRIAVTLGLLVYILSKTDLENLWLELQNIHLDWYLLGLAASVVSIAISVYKWRLLLGYLGYRRPYGSLLRLQLYGIFFNNILPTSIGGDAVRAYCVSRGGTTGGRIGLADAAASILVQRLTGLAALVLLGAVFLLALPGARARHEGALIIALLGAIIVIIAVVSFSHRSATFFMELLNRFTLGKVGDKLAKLAQAVLRYRGRAKGMIAVLVLSFLFQVVVCLSVYFLGLSLSIDIPLSYYFFYVPLGTMIMMGPSIGGHGLREGAYFFLFASAGSGKAISLSLLFLSCVTLEGIVGGLAFAISGVQRGATQRWAKDHLEDFEEASAMRGGNQNLG